MREAGFNLFTALVAIVLVVLAAILTHTMTGSERNIIDIISDIEEEQKMQTIADLARADALHAFNFGIRFTIERWLTKDGDPDNPADLPDGIPDNKYVLTPEIADLSWEEIKKDFARTNFGICEDIGDGRVCQGRQLATRAANHLTALLERTPDVRGYNIDLDAPQTTELQQLLQKVFDKSSEEDEFFTVINCDGTWANCPNGTFYINLNLKRPQDGGYLTDEEYEKFPQVVVTNRLTNRVLKEPILPRGNIQIYVPLRLFKAISGGLEIAKGNSEGIFENYFRESTDKYKVGICGNSGCAPIKDPRTGDLYPNSADYACVGDTLNASGSTKHPIIDFLGLLSSRPYSYDPSGDKSMNNTLSEYVEEEVLHPAIKKMVENKVQEQENFKVVRSGDKAALNANAIVLAEPSRRIEILGLAGGDAGTAYCSKVRIIEATVVFEDSDERYIVSDTDKSGTNRYAIKFKDTTYSAVDLGSGVDLPVCRTVTSGLGLGQVSCEEG